MGFFRKLFGLPMKCPICGMPGAKETDRGIKCVSPSCRYYNRVYAVRLAMAGGRSPSAGEPVQFKQPIEIQYVNRRGERKTFIGEGGAIRSCGEHFSVKVLPTGRRISLKREKIINRQDVEKAAASVKMPTARERQILNFHTKYGTTSALYGSLRAKYPNY